jgi:hypothetical protein
VIKKKKAIRLANDFEVMVFNTISEIGLAIQCHASLGIYEMEVFVSNKIAKKAQIKLISEGYRARLGEFSSNQNCCLIYVSWTY